MLLVGEGHNGQPRPWGSLEEGRFLRTVPRLESLQSKATGGVLLDSPLWRVLAHTKKYEYTDDLGTPCKIWVECEVISFEESSGTEYRITVARARTHGGYKKINGKSRYEIPLEFFDVISPSGEVRSGREIMPGAPHKGTTGSPILTLEHLEEVVAHFCTLPEFVFDVETYGEHALDPRRNDVLWISLAGPGECWTINVSFQYPDGPPCLPGPETWAALRPLLFGPGRKIGHNVRFDLQSVVKYYDEIPPGPYGDTMGLLHMLDENLGNKKLKPNITRLYDFSYESLAKHRGINTYGFTEAALYSYLDSKYTWIIWRQLFPLIEEEGLMTVWDLEMDLLGTICAMEYVGHPINEADMKRMEVSVRLSMQECEKAIYEMLGQEFDLNSAPQKGRIIYDVLGHAPKNFTTTGQRSTKDEDLRLYMKDPVVARMMEWGDYQKVHSTYLVGFLDRMNNGFVHGSFNQFGTNTGRFSSSAPNLQNLPARDELDALGTGQKIRDLFIAPEGYTIVDADYSQIEVRILAHYSRSPYLVNGFLEGMDAHSLAAAAAYGIDPSEVDKAMRQVGKGLNFAVIYGAGPDKVASMAGISVREAEAAVETLKSNIPEIERLKKTVINKARSRKPPHVRTILGRRRRVPAVMSGDFKTRSRAERQLFNALIQGSAADAMKVAMVQLDAAFLDAGWGAYMTMTVHDEVICLCPDSTVDKTVALVKEVMEGVNLFSIPLKADVGTGLTWGSAK